MKTIIEWEGKDVVAGTRIVDMTGSKCIIATRSIEGGGTDPRDLAFVWTIVRLADGFALCFHQKEGLVYQLNVGLYKPEKYA